MEEERGSLRDRRSQQSRLGLSFLQCQMRERNSPIAVQEQEVMQLACWQY